MLGYNLRVLFIIHGLKVSVYVILHTSIHFLIIQTSPHDVPCFPSERVFNSQIFPLSSSTPWFEPQWKTVWPILAIQLIVYFFQEEAGSLVGSEHFWNNKTPLELESASDYCMFYLLKIKTPVCTHPKWECIIWVIIYFLIKCLKNFIGFLEECN